MACVLRGRGRVPHNLGGGGRHSIGLTAATCHPFGRSGGVETVPSGTKAPIYRSASHTRGELSMKARLTSVVAVAALAAAPLALTGSAQAKTVGTWAQVDDGTGN